MWGAIGFCRTCRAGYLAISNIYLGDESVAYGLIGSFWTEFGFLLGLNGVFY